MTRRSLGGPPPGQTLAVTAESLYLGNLLVIPGLCFIILLVLYFKHRTNGPPLAVCHLRQTVSASLWAGALLVIANGVIVALGGYDAGYTWMVVITYFTTAHATLVLLGMFGLSKALAGQPFRYPLVGRPCPEVA